MSDEKQGTLWHGHQPTAGLTQKDNHSCSQSHLWPIYNILIYLTDMSLDSGRMPED